MNAGIKPARSLRAVLSITTCLVVALTVVVSGSLIALTTFLHRTTAEAARSAELIRLAEEVEVDLLLHERAADSLTRRDLEASLRRRLAEVREIMEDEDLESVVTAAEAASEAYIAASLAQGPAEVSPEAMETAYVALEAVVAVARTHAREAQQRAAHWDRLANVIGVTVGALMIIVSAGIVAWLKHRAFAPILDLAAALNRFAQGDHDARASESGAAELRDMSARFNDMATALAGQRRSQMAFLAGIAHDLRGPLSVLRASVAALRPTEGPTDVLGADTSALDRIDRQISHMERMINDFLDMTRIEAGRLELKLDTCDVRSIVLEAVDYFRECTPDRRFQVSMPTEVVPVLCDPLRIEQVMVNLISNAVKYSPAGSIVEVGVEKCEKRVGLSVSDEGTGISELDQQRLFEPFRRACLTKDVVPGSGLGLAVVRRIVDAHCGVVKVNSAIGQGSTFRVLLPTINANRQAMEKLKRL